jgi:hypothetical protein
MKKIIAGVLIVILLAIAAIFIFVHEKLPEGGEFKAADELAREMLLAVNDSAWQQTGAVAWTFMGSHEHLWDRERHLAQVKWKGYEVLVDLSKIEGMAWKKGKALEGRKRQKIVEKAWKFWVNDSFWLNPVSKAFDEGTTRSLVRLKDGREGLMVSYSSGGDTPGDSYVWILGQDHLPVSWKMWVSILPVGGIEVPWNGWITTETGALVCALHDAAVDLKLENISTAASLSDLTGGADPFAPLF